MTTIRFGSGSRDNDELLAQAAGLPRDIAPARDLWPGIAARLPEQSRASPRSLRLPMALAAGVLVAAASALLTWGLMRAPATDGGEEMLAGRAASPAALLPVSYGPHSALGQEQLKARDELLVHFRRRLAELPPETRDTVVRNLAIIQRAADEIDAALAMDPASGLLNGLLLSTYQEELQLYSKVVTAGDALTRRS
jgi:hypothetical protein